MSRPPYGRVFVWWADDGSGDRRSLGVCGDRVLAERRVLEALDGMPGPGAHGEVATASTDCLGRPVYTPPVPLAHYYRDPATGRIRRHPPSPPC
ncbi:hypothetical protein [Spongiactinospora sp. TRM90649]|uniref:hypothetical protein n=1 Tax=Spongiactinospora sp. TRM90649 TaxID=3031114 RepID=UPI0023F7179A|nr:hypothetical protein [Spongiactinospora sp. TRM90649]MDF5751557.1 hypothetical protein [Spongiactinospora sp. TRM90649]